MAGVDKVSPELLKVLTLTAPGKDRLPGPKEVRLWNEQAGECWERFVRLVRVAYPEADVELWKVWETQERGALHVHGLIRGVKWFNLKEFGAIVVAAGFGPRFSLEACKVSKGGVRGLLGYFSKYLLKAVDGWEGKNHVITSSRGWAIDWKRRRQEKRESEWIWISARDAVVFVNSWVPVDGRPESRVDVLGPPGGESDGLES
jgi:hypothetical protein